MDASTISIVISSVLLIAFIVGHIRNTIALQQIHDLVNSKMTKTLNKVEALEAKTVYINRDGTSNPIMGNASIVRLTVYEYQA